MLVLQTGVVPAQLAKVVDIPAVTEERTAGLEHALMVSAEGPSAETASQF